MKNNNICQRIILVLYFLSFIVIFLNIPFEYCDFTYAPFWEDCDYVNWSKLMLFILVQTVFFGGLYFLFINIKISKIKNVVVQIRERNVNRNKSNQTDIDDNYIDYLNSAFENDNKEESKLVDNNKKDINKYFKIMLFIFLTLILMVVSAIIKEKSGFFLIGPISVYVLYKLMFPKKEKIYKENNILDSNYKRDIYVSEKNKNIGPYVLLFVIVFLFIYTLVQIYM